MIAIIDPVLDAVLSKRYDEPDINRNIFNTLFEVACIQFHPYSEDKTIYKYMQDTMLQVFLTQDYVTLFGLEFIHLKMLMQKIKLTTDDDFSKKLQQVIIKRTKIFVSDEKPAENMVS
jgi:hypothetical protein